VEPGATIIDRGLQVCMAYSPHLPGSVRKQMKHFASFIKILDYTNAI